MPGGEVDGGGSSGGSGRRSGPRPWIEVEVYEGQLGGCTDLLWVRRTLVWPDGTRRVLSNTCLARGTPPPAPRAPAPPSAAPVAPLDAQVWDAVPLPSTTVSINPRVRGLVGLETRLWHDHLEPVTATVTIAGTTVEARAEPIAYRWTTGDGATYTADRGGSETDPAATHVYDHHRTYDVTATVTWRGEYRVVGGAWQPLGTVDRSATRAYRVVEAQAVRRR